VTDEEGKGWQKHTWGVITKELDTISPGCIEEVLTQMGVKVDMLESRSMIRCIIQLFRCFILKFLG
jgi:hypothetical protein